MQPGVASLNIIHQSKFPSKRVSLRGEAPPQTLHVFINTLTSQGSRHLIHYDKRTLPGWMDGSLPSAALCAFGIFVFSEAPEWRNGRRPKWFPFLTVRGLFFPLKWRIKNLSTAGHYKSSIRYLFQICTETQQTYSLPYKSTYWRYDWLQEGSSPTLKQVQSDCVPPHTDCVT